MLDLVLFTHNDMDGFGCQLVMDITMAIIGRTKELSYEIFTCTNNNIDYMVNKYVDEMYGFNLETVIVFSDIAPSENCMRDLLKLDDVFIDISNIYVYDHHETNLYVKDILHDNAHIYIDEFDPYKECGTSLLYKACLQYLYNGGYNTDDLRAELFSEIIELIRLYDTYEWKSSNEINAKKLNILFSMIGGDNFVKKYYKRIMNDDDEGRVFSDTELEFINFKYLYNQDIVNKVSPDDFIITYIRGHKVALLMKGIAANINEIADKFLEEFPEFDAVVQLSMFGAWQFSIRSRKEGINSAKLFAEPIGGGGHSKACGAPVPEFIKSALTNTIIEYLNGNNVSLSVSTNNKYEG